MSATDMLSDTLNRFGDGDGLAVVEVGKRLWRVFHLATTDTGRPKLTDLSELCAVACELRPPTRGRGAQPIPAEFGATISRKIAATTGARVWVQVEGVDRFEGWCEP
jgi:hypothetical protein